MPAPHAMYCFFFDFGFLEFGFMSHMLPQPDRETQGDTLVRFVISYPRYPGIDVRKAMPRLPTIRCVTPCGSTWGT